MPRKRQHDISIEARTLRTLHRRHRDTPLEARVRMLMLLRSGPTRSLASIAAELERSLASVQRWWKLYRDGGVEALLAVTDDRRGGRRRLDESGMEALRKAIMRGSVASISEAMGWLRRELGIGYSRSTVWRIVHHDLDAGDHMSRDVRRREHVEERPGDEPGSEALIAFMNTLGEPAPAVERPRNVQRALKLLLPEIDRASVSITLRPFHDRSTFDPRMEEERADGHANAHMETSRRRGLRVDEYHPPTIYKYFSNEGLYIGVVVLYREKHKPPFTSRVERTLERIAPFMRTHIALLGADALASDPRRLTTVATMLWAWKEKGLTDQEARVLSLRLIGLSYKEISGRLGIALNTTRGHIKTIHQKTGTHSLGEIIAKYLSMRGDLPERDVGVELIPVRQHNDITIEVRNRPGK